MYINKNFLNSFKKNATLKLYDGCGDVLESWIFENASEGGIMP